jgi:hypothetical protein
VTHLYVAIGGAAGYAASGSAQLPQAAWYSSADPGPQGSAGQPTLRSCYLPSTQGDHTPHRMAEEEPQDDNAPREAGGELPGYGQARQVALLNRLPDLRQHIGRNDGRTGGKGGVTPAAVSLNVFEQQFHLPDLTYLRGDDLIGQLPHPRIVELASQPTQPSALPEVTQKPAGARLIVNRSRSARRAKNFPVCFPVPRSR